LPENANAQFPVIVYRDQWPDICREIDRAVCAEEQLRGTLIFYYVARHCLKNNDLAVAAKELAASFDNESKFVFGIQLHLAVTFKTPDYAVMLRQDAIGKIVSGDNIAYFRP